MSISIRETEVPKAEFEFELAPGVFMYVQRYRDDEGGNRYTFFLETEGRFYLNDFVPADSDDKACQLAKEELKEYLKEIVQELED
jgi:hypothetical protein